MNDDAIIDLQGVQFGYAGRAVLDIAQLQVRAGSSVLLRGTSGSGKSTLLGLLAGILLPASGSIRVAGHRVNTLGAAARDRFRADQLGVIFQQFNLLPFLSVRENVELPCHFSALRRQRARERHGSPAQAASHLLGQLGLGGELHERRADSLSIGQQQRVAAARALIGQPELVIADEPTSALDADSREAFLQLLFAECREAGASLLFVSHDQSLAGLFDRSLSLSDLNRAARPAGL